jgi:hypothetical protein
LLLLLLLEPMCEPYLTLLLYRNPNWRPLLLLLLMQKQMLQHTTLLLLLLLLLAAARLSLAGSILPRHVIWREHILTPHTLLLP